MVTEKGTDDVAPKKKGVADGGGIHGEKGKLGHKGRAGKKLLRVTGATTAFPGSN